MNKVSKDRLIDDQTWKDRSKKLEEVCTRQVHEIMDLIQEVSELKQKLGEPAHKPRRKK